MPVETTRFTYIPGGLTIERLNPGYSGRFRLEGNWAIGRAEGSDHFQLIYEALEIAAHSDDKFKKVFEAFVNEFMTLTEDWDQ
jgi:hypothetical protein